MIVMGLLELVFGLFSLLTLPINIPALPDSVSVVLNSVMGYIQSGLSMLACFVDLEYLLVLFGVVVAVEAGLRIYKFVVFVLDSIPFLNAG